MKEHTQDHVEGKGREIKGGMKEAAGRIVGDEEMEAEGKGEKFAGKVQGKVGDVKKVFEQ